jgi:hypothetical protein
VGDWANFPKGSSKPSALYVRQLAWLNTAARPKPKRGRRSEPDDAPAEPPRREWYEKGGDALPLPECPDEVLVGWLLEAGPVMAGGMSMAPLTWLEISAWQERMALELQPWENALLVRMSREYAAEASVAGDEDRAPPWKDTWPARAKREAIDRAVRTSLSAAANSAPVDPARRNRRKT